MNYYIEESYYPTVKELLNLPIFSTSYLAAGESGLNRTVSGINLSDNPDYGQWISPGELMISTCFSVYQDPDAMNAYIPTLVQNQMAAFCIKPSQYLDNVVPPIMIQQANEAGFPLIVLPPDMQFSRITQVLSDELTRRRTALLRNTLSVNQMLTQTITEGANLDEIAFMISQLTGGSILIVDSVNNRHSIFLKEEDRSDFKADSESQMINTLIQRSQAHDLTLGDHSYGCLYIYNPTQSPALPPELLSQVLTAIPLEITREQSVREQGDSLFTSFLLHLLSDPIVDHQLEQTRADEFKLTLADNHLILRLKTQIQDEKNQYKKNFQHTLLMGNIRSVFSRLGLDVRIVPTSDDYLILLNAPASSSDLEHLSHHIPKLITSLAQEYPDLHISAGCGRSHPGIRGIVQSDTEARTALRTALLNQQTVLDFENLGLLRLLYAADPEKETSLFVQELLGPLIETDHQKHTDLLKTLDYYFEYAGNVKRISEEMFTHYNTIAYRIKSIQEITKKDLHNRNDHFLLEAAVYLYKFKVRF